MTTRQRTFWSGDFDARGDYFTGQPVKATEAEANLVGSRIEGAKGHAPCIDIDLPCRLVESSTPGHFHLYIDTELSWDQYVQALAGLAAAGLVEPGYFAACLRHGQTFVRKPGVVKAQTPPPSAVADDSIPF